MKIKGIKRGQTIELLEQVESIPDGTEVTIELDFTKAEPNAAQLSPNEVNRLTRLNQLFGTWEDQPDLVEIFEEIDRERHTYRGRDINAR